MIDCEEYVHIYIYINVAGGKKRSWEHPHMGAKELPGVPLNMVGQHICFKVTGYPILYKFKNNDPFIDSLNIHRHELCVVIGAKRLGGEEHRLVAVELGPGQNPNSSVCSG